VENLEAESVSLNHLKLPKNRDAQLSTRSCLKSVDQSLREEHLLDPARNPPKARQADSKVACQVIRRQVRSQQENF